MKMYSHILFIIVFFVINAVAMDQRYDTDHPYLIELQSKNLQKGLEKYPLHRSAYSGIILSPSEEPLTPDEVNVPRKSNGLTPLHYAALGGKKTNMFELLRAAANPAIVSGHIVIEKSAELDELIETWTERLEGLTPLMMAVFNRKFSFEDIAQLALYMPAELLQDKASGEKAEQFESIKHGLFMAVLSAGTMLDHFIAKQKALGKSVDVKDHGLFLYNLYALETAAKVRNFMKFTLIDGREFVVPLYTKGATPLYYAAFYGLQKSIDMLIKAGANVNVRDEDLGATPLHRAAEMGWVEVVKKLLGAGANPAMLDKNGESPFDYAIRHSRTEILTILAENASSSFALHKACENDDVATIQLLLIRNVCVVNLRDDYGKTALHYAVLRCQPLPAFIIKDLLRAGFDPLLCDNEGFDSLYYSILAGNYDSLKVLLNEHRQGLDLNRAYGNDKASLMDCAIRTRSAKIVQLLHSAGAVIDKKLIDDARELVEREAYIALAKQGNNGEELLQFFAWPEITGNPLQDLLNILKLDMSRLIMRAQARRNVASRGSNQQPFTLLMAQAGSL